MEAWTSIDYIIATLKRWERKFPNIIVRYAYEKDTAFHIITVGPNELYYKNPEYINEENQLWDSFDERYPNEKILICEPKHSLNIENVLYPFTEISKEELNKRRIDVYKHIL